jgi:ABC-2 type transport system ATP-binding protein
MEISHLTKSYGKLEVLSDINMDCKPGHIYGIMGENGAGKSTLFRCIMGLESFKGEVRKEEVSQIGYLPDIPYYYPLVTAGEFIEFCLRARRMAIDKDEIEKLNQSFRLPLGKYPSQYSLGMKKRLMLLVLMLQHNDVYVMDEPFNGLDLAGGIILKRWMMKMKGEGKLLIVSSHIIASLADICDKIFYIYQGKLADIFVGCSVSEIEDAISKKYLHL